MKNIIRARISINLPENQPISESDLAAMRPLFERAIVSAIPGDIRVDTVQVTRINMAKPEDDAAAAEE